MDYDSLESWWYIGRILRCHWSDPYRCQNKGKKFSAVVNNANGIDGPTWTDVVEPVLDAVGAMVDVRGVGRRKKVCDTLFTSIKSAEAEVFVKDSIDATLIIIGSNSQNYYPANTRIRIRYAMRGQRNEALRLRERASVAR